MTPFPSNAYILYGRLLAALTSAFSECYQLGLSKHSDEGLSLNSSTKPISHFKSDGSRKTIIDNIHCLSALLSAMSRPGRCCRAFGTWLSTWVSLFTRLRKMRRRTSHLPPEMKCCRAAAALATAGKWGCSGRQRGPTKWARLSSSLSSQCSMPASGGLPSTST